MFINNPEDPHKNIRQLAKTLLDAIDDSPGEIFLGNRSLKDLSPSGKRITRKRMQEMIAKKFKEKYFL